MQARQRHVVVNGVATESGAQTLAELLVALGYGASKVATAVDGEFVPERARAERRLTEGASIEIVAPRQGG